jgi:membrane dipeptidase
LAHPTVDLHAHPGRFFLEDVSDPTPRMAAFGKPFTDTAIADLAAGNVSAVLFAGVADTRLLDATPAGALYAAREFAPDEAWRDYRRQVAVLRRLVAQRGLARGMRASDIVGAKKRRTTACIFAIEGGDFIEDRLDRIDEAHADGVRAITIVHYHNNQIGDIQTQPRETGGLTATGRSIVKAMNRTGIIVDLAHASPRVVRDALDVADKPAMASHTNLNRPDFQHPRLISNETARLIATGGGVIGSVPSGIGQQTFGDWIDSILRLIDVVGVAHVAIGTDMDANYAPVFTNYRSWPTIPAALLARGLRDDEVAAIMGANFQRLFKCVSG